jgi:LemA protein
MRRFWAVLAALASLSLSNCGYNAIQSNDEQVKSAWSEVVNQYQRRADLVPMRGPRSAASRRRWRF